MGNFTSKIISFNHRKCKCKHHIGVTFNNNNNNNNNHNHNVNCNHNANHNNDSNYGKLFQSIVVKDKEVVSNDLVHLDHHIMREVWQSNFSSPVDDILKEGGAKVLDVGCGLGAWLCEISISYPKSQFTGIDILSIFPTIKPFNVNFMQTNVLEGLPFEDNTFDFVHIRGLVYDLTESQWLNIVYQELLRVLKPGGWLEIADAETKGTNIGPFNEFVNDSIINNAISGNVNPRIVDSHYSNLHSVVCSINNNGNEKVVIHHLKRRCPVGKWGGKLGEATLIFIIGSIRNYYINLKTKNALKLYKSFINSSNENAVKYRNKEIKNYEELLELHTNEFETYKSFFNYHRFYYQKK